MKQSLKAKYLEQFPENHRQFVHNRFSQAYVFTAQSYEFNEEDEIDLAVGPRTMRARVIAACEELIPAVDAERQGILQQVIDTIDESTEFMTAIKGEVDADWEEARQYQEAHPPKADKKADPPSQPQLDWLKQLGCTSVPTSKKEASKLIDKYKHKGSYVRNRT